MSDIEDIDDIDSVESETDEDVCHHPDEAQEERLCTSHSVSSALNIFLYFSFSVILCIVALFHYHYNNQLNFTNLISNNDGLSVSSGLDRFKDSYKQSDYFRSLICHENEGDNISLSLDFQCCPDKKTYNNSIDGTEDFGSAYGSLHETNRNITLLVYMNGQMGNYLSYVARSYGVKRSMEKVSNNTIQFELVGSHRRDQTSEWITVKNQLKTCFPSFFGSFRFESGKWDSTGEFQRRQKQLSTWIDKLNLTLYDPLNIDPHDCRHYDPNCWHASYCQLQHMLRLQQRQKHQLEAHKGDVNSSTFHVGHAVFDIQEPSNSNISMPYLTATNLPYIEAVDDYYDEFKDYLFQFNASNEACCDSTIDKPYDDEIVFHFRNYGSKRLENGFHEMQPEQAATEIFKNYPPGTKIAIVARDFTNSSMAYEQAFKSKGFVVRHINHPENSLHDFCFISQTVREIVGMKLSTFVTWAALLSEAKLIRLYVIDSPFTQKFHNAIHLMAHHQFRNKKLKGRVVFETYKQL